MKIKLSFIAAIILVAAVIYAILPLYGQNYIPTHDGEYHIIRIVEFARMLGSGYLFPRWAPDMNSGYGIPLFNFNYPLPDYIGSFVRVFTHDAVYAFQGSMGLAYVGMAISSFLWLSALFGSLPALTGATVAVFVPYVFVDIYVRGSVGELWATFFLFFSLYCIEKKRFFWIAVSFALLILSHNILAMLYAPFLLMYVWMRSKKALPWMLGGLGLSAYFWLPALLEAKYVQGLNTVNFREHFVQIYEMLIPSWGTQFSGIGSLGNKISFQIGIIPLAVLIGSVFVKKKQRDLHNLLLYLLTVLGLCVLLMLPVAQPIWEAVKPLQLVQYPWRLLSFVIPVSSFCAAYLVSSTKMKWWGIVISVLAVVLTASYARPAVYAPRNEAYYVSRPNFTEGTSSMGNSFSTIWTGWKETKSDLPYTGRYLDRQYTVTKESPGDTTIPVLYFPGWHAAVDGTETGINYVKDGVIHITVPAGQHTVRVYFGETPVRMIADIISIVSIGLLILIWILR